MCFDVFTCTRDSRRHDSVLCNHPTRAAAASGAASPEPLDTEVVEVEVLSSNKRVEVALFEKLPSSQFKLAEVVVLVPKARVTDAVGEVSRMGILLES